MRYSELFEAVSQQVFHYTSIHNAYRILAQRRFKLSPAGGTDSEVAHQRGKLYFLSTARSPAADYTVQSAYYYGVVFNLNGNWLNQRHKGAAVDYWERMWASGQGRTSEQEDRVLSDKPYIEFPKNTTALISAVHILVRPGERDFQDRYAGTLRGLIFEAKRQGIPVFVYETVNDWLVQDTRKSVLTTEYIQSLTGQRPKPYSSRYASRDDFEKYREMYYKNTMDSLSKAASDEVWKMLSYSDRGRVLDNDIHNSKKDAPEGLAKLLAIFKRLGVRTGSQFVTAMTEKWKAIADAR